jgi:hypothetical protein
MCKHENASVHVLHVCSHMSKPLSIRGITDTILLIYSIRIVFDKINIKKIFILFDMSLDKKIIIK